jgi:hypothetical protein
MSNFKKEVIMRDRITEDVIWPIWFVAAVVAMIVATLIAIGLVDSTKHMAPIDGRCPAGWHLKRYPYQWVCEGYYL